MVLSKKETRLTCGRVSACRAWGAVWARLVVRQAVLCRVLRCVPLVRLLINRGGGMARRVPGRMRCLLWRCSLGMVLLMNDAGRSMVLKMRRWWGLVGIMLHREDSH